MKTTEELSAVITKLSEIKDTEIQNICVQAQDLINEIEGEISDMEIEEDSHENEIDNLKDTIKENEEEILKLQTENDNLMKGLHASNMHEEDKLEVCNRLFINLTLNQLLELEKIGKNMNKNYNEYAT